MVCYREYSGLGWKGANTSAWCHVWTAPCCQEFERCRTAGRSCHVFGLLMRHLSWPLAIMLSADWVPVKSTRSLGAMAQVGCPDLWADWLGCVMRSLPFPTSWCGRVSRLFAMLPQTACGSGALYFSPRAIIAQAIRAILLANATAAIFVDRRSISLTSQGWHVYPSILARLMTDRAPMTSSLRR